MRGIRADWLWMVVGTIGVTLSVGVAIFVGIQAALPSFNQSPWVRFWVVAYAGLFVGMVILGYFQRGRWLIAFTCAALAAFVLISVVQANTGLAFLMLAWILGVAFGIGDKVFDLLAPYTSPRAFERFILSICLGLGALALLVLGLGSLGLLYAWVSIAMLAILTGVTLPNLARFLRRLTTEWVPRMRADWQSKDLRFSAIVLSSLAVCFLGGLVWALAPSIQFDALVYHLGVPAIYLQNHSIIEVREEFRSYWVHNAEMLYTLGLLLADQPLPGMIHLVFGVLTAGLTFALGRRIGDTRVGLVAALLFYSIPVVTWASGTTYTDLIITLFAFAAFFAAIAWSRDKRDGWLILVGLFAGLAMGSKLNAVLALLPIAMFVFIGLVYRYGISRRFLICLLAAAMPALLVFAPWLFRDWWWTGNPIFPFYNAVFQGPKWDLGNTFFNFGVFGTGHGLFDLVRLPIDLEVNSYAFIEAVPAGMVGGVTLLAVPWMYLKSTSRLPSVAIIWLVVLGTTVLWFGIGQYLRYLLPIFPLLCILAALNVESLWEALTTSAWRHQIVGVGTVLALGYLASTRFVVTVSEWQIPERFPYTVALGLEAPGAFLSRSLPVYDALRFLNRTGNGRYKVLSMGNEFRLYTNSQIWGISGSREALMIASSLPPGPGLAHSLIQEGYDFLLVNQSEINANPQMYKLPVLDKSFLDHFSRLEYSNGNVYLYKLLPQPEVSHSSAESLTWNSSFEEGSAEDVEGWVVYGAPIIDRSGTRAHTGKVAVMANGPSGLYERVQVTAGELYTLGHWTRADEPQQFARLQINWLDDNLRIVAVAIQVVPVGSEWQWHQMSVNAPQGATFAQVYASVHENSEVWFDDFVFVRGEYK